MVTGRQVTFSSLALVLGWVLGVLLFSLWDSTAYGMLPGGPGKHGGWNAGAGVGQVASIEQDEGVPPLQERT